MSVRKEIQLLLIVILVLFKYNRIYSQEIYLIPKDVKSGLSSFENLNGVKGQGGVSNKSAKGNAFESLPAGESKVLLNIHLAGKINRMWFTINDRSDTMLRSLRFRIYWDDQSKPAVDVPFGDFFCAALGIPVAFQSDLFTNPEGRSFNCYIPMPFRKAARVTLTNESDKDLTLLFFDIDYTTFVKPPDDMLTVATGKSIFRLLDTPMSVNDPSFPNGWVNFYRVDDYSATAYFYLDRPVSNLPGLATVSERIK